MALVQTFRFFGHCLLLLLLLSGCNEHTKHSLSYSIFWTDAVYMHIKSYSMSDKETEELVNKGLGFPWGIVVDSESRKMYWTDRGTNLIRRTNFDGSNTEDLVSLPQSNDGRALALALPIGKMYWTDGAGKLLRSNLDGTGVQVVVASSPRPYGLALDLRGVQPSGACCDASVPGGGCTDDVPESNCPTSNPSFNWSANTSCSNVVCVEDTPAADDEPGMPTTSEWGMAVVMLLLLAGLTIKFGLLRSRKTA